MKTKHQFTSWWVNLFLHLLPSFLLAKLIPWHFHVFHTKRAQMDSWNAASNCTENRPGYGPAAAGFCGRDNFQVIPSWSWRHAGVADPRPKDGQGGQREHAWLSTGDHALGQRAGRGGRGPELSHGPVPTKMATFLILNMCLGPHRGSCGHSIISTNMERGPAWHWMNEWPRTEKDCPRKPGGSHLISRGLRGQNADVCIVKSQQSIFLLCHNSHIMTIIPFLDRNIFISS